MRRAFAYRPAPRRRLSARPEVCYKPGMGLLRSPPPPAGLVLSRWALFALVAGVLSLSPTAARAASGRSHATVRLPSTTHKSTRHSWHRGHHRQKLRDCPTKRGGDNDQNGNGVDDRCDT